MVFLVMGHRRVPSVANGKAPHKPTHPYKRRRSREGVSPVFLLFLKPNGIPGSRCACPGMTTITNGYAVRKNRPAQAALPAYEG